MSREGKLIEFFLILMHVACVNQLDKIKNGHTVADPGKIFRGG